MSVKLVFLGKLADIAGEAVRDMSAPLNWERLLAHLGEDLASEIASDRVRIALDGELLADKAQLVAQDGSEVALLPPVSGG